MDSRQSQEEADLVLAHLLADEGDEAAEAGHNEIGNLPPPPAPTSTLLPYPVAWGISSAVRTTNMAIRAGTFVGGMGIAVTKATTLGSLEFSRNFLGGILSRTGRNVVSESKTHKGKEDAEHILERSLDALHSTMSQVVFWTSAGFVFTRTTMNKVSATSQILLSVLDQVLGDTDSSKAIVSIIALVRREFQNPATGVQGEQVSVTDLFWGTAGLAYLQISSRKLIRDEARRLGQEEVIWDVVVLDGERVDVHHDSQTEVTDHMSRLASQFEITPETSDEDDMPEARVKQHILRSLPRNADVSITTATTTTKTITVEVKGLHSRPQLNLPGLDMIEREVYDSADAGRSGSQTNYKFVYRTTQNRFRDHSQPQSEKNDNRLWDLQDSEDEDESVLQIAGRKATDSDLVDQKVSLKADDEKPPVPPPKPNTENAANQKKTRRPLDDERPPSRTNHQAGSTKAARRQGANETPEKKTGLKSVLKTGSVTSLGGLLNKDPSNSTLKSKSSLKPPWGSSKAAQTKSQASTSRNPAPNRNSLLPPTRDSPRIPQRGAPNYFSSRDLGYLEDHSVIHKSPSGSSFIEATERKRRNSIVSQTESFSMQSRPSSPTLHRLDQRASGGYFGTRWDADQDESAGRSHNKSRSHLSYAPSVQTLQTSASQTSLVLSTVNYKSVYSDSENVDTLRQTGIVDGIFPNFHILRNITRYSKYASAAYGKDFLRYMGISSTMPNVKVTDDEVEDIRYFTHHTGLTPENILLSSFVDAQGGSDSTGSTGGSMPLVHTIAVDEESKAVVLACRGTLGFDDVLVDMMCEYDDLTWRGRTYKVHKGIHASARRLLYGGDGRVLLTLKEALEEFPDYGLVLCGHSLGAAVTALLGIMLAEPATSSTAFVTSAQQHRRLLGDKPGTTTLPPVCLPTGRPIHVYAYGPPATMSPSLQKATRGLITSTVHGNDLVPYLSLGVLHDLQAVALAFKTDNSEAKAEIRRHFIAGLRTGLADKWYNNAPKAARINEEQWAFAALKTLRASTMSPKLLPPGEVFSIECSAALRRDAFLRAPEEQFGRPATRIVLKYIRDVETHFREMRFGASMFLDHSPGRYEDALRKLTMGVVGSEG